MQKQQGIQQQQGSLAAVAQGDAAFARVNVAGGTPSFAMNRGFASLADTGAGVVTLTLQNAVNLTSGATIDVCVLFATAAHATVTITSETVIVVRTWDVAGMALDDVSFTVRITAVGPA